MYQEEKKRERKGERKKRKKEKGGKKSKCQTEKKQANKRDLQVLQAIDKRARL